MLLHADQTLSRMPRRMVALLVFCLWVAACAVDYLSGCEITLAVLYVLPISMATWYLGRRSGFLLSLISTAAVIAPDLVESRLLIDHPCYVPWRWFSYCGVFGFIVVLLNSVHLHLEHERHLARLDSLTGLLNRRAFCELLESCLKCAGSARRPLSLAYLDLDDFKGINDEFGHHVGDHVLQRVAQVLARNSRSSDGVARIGGDEFALLLPDAEVLVAEKLIRRLRESLQKAFGAEDVAVTCSIGVVTFRTLPRDSDEAMKAADLAMYRVKSQGKNAVDFLVAGPGHEGIVDPVA